MLIALFIAMHAGATADFAPRVAVLEGHLERLHAITVPHSLEAEKAAKLGKLKELLRKGAKTAEEFNALYNKMDAVRMWLWKNAADRPQRVQGEYKETDSAWELRTPTLKFRLAKTDFAMDVTTAKAAWRFQPCDDHDIELGGKTFSLLSAGKKHGESFDTGYSNGLLLTLSESPAAPGD